MAALLQLWRLFGLSVFLAGIDRRLRSHELKNERNGTM